MLPSGCFVGLCDPFLFQEISGVEHTCLALWMRVCITDNFVKIGWLEL